MYRVINPNAVLNLVRRTLNTPAVMGEKELVILLTGKKLVDLGTLDREFKKVFGRGVFDVVDEIKIVKL